VPARLRSLGRTGLVLIVANEIRGVLMVAALLTGAGDTGLPRLEAAQAQAACAIAPSFCRVVEAAAGAQSGLTAG
jgi:hypothetical protein